MHLHTGCAQSLLRDVQQEEEAAQKTGSYGKGLIGALLGGVLGLVKCALLLFLAVWVLQKLQLLVTPELVNKTVLLKFFAQNSPIDLIAKL